MNFSEIQPLLQESLKKIKHVVIKIGTNSITPHIENQNSIFFHELADVVLFLQKSGINPIIVSSGAVGLGKELLKREKKDYVQKKITLVEKQALASLGQSLLIDIYRDAFERKNIPIAQILVSKSDFQNRKHYQNLKYTIEQLINWKSVPVINENDAVATEELKVGDNDTLSELIAGMHPYTFLIMLTTVDGFIIENKKIDFIDKISDKYFKHAQGPNEGGIGGMKTKLKSAEKILLSGHIMNICSGKSPKIIYDLLKGEPKGTWFFTSLQKNEVAAKKRWLLHNRHITGSLYIDKGAKEALISKNASLLIVGIEKYDGVFNKGDIIEIFYKDKKLGKGIISYSNKELEDFLISKKEERGLEVIHRDNLILL
ncbi:MAG: glutamate 5-kinase [Spirochaetia bacterium]|nr:glutamate 5-kinase [Spirochaetia bacterium]